MPHVFNFPEIAEKKYRFMAKAVQEKKDMNGEKQRFGGWIRMCGKESSNKAHKCALPFPKRLWKKRTVAMHGVKSSIQIGVLLPLWIESKTILNKQKWKHVAIVLACHV